MAVTAWTQRQVVDLLPKWLSKCVRAYRQRLEAIATEAGLRPQPLNLLVDAPRWLGVDVITVERYRWRRPYVLKEPWTPAWEELVAAGLAERADGGWRVTERGVALRERVTRDVRSYLESLQLPRVELPRATKVLVDLAAAIPADSARAMAARRGLVLRDEVRSDVARLEVTIWELEPRRDDCHIAAWQRAGYAGPVLDVLSAVWGGKVSLAEVVKVLALRQERSDVEHCLGELVRRGDLVRDADALALTPPGKKRRDDIEADTDRLCLAGWPEGEALARLGDDLSAIVAALP